MRRKLGKYLCSLLVTMSIVFGMLSGLIPGTSLTAYAAETTITWSQSELQSINYLFNGGSKTIDGVTLKAIEGEVHVGFIDDGFQFMGYADANSFQFSTTLGNFTKIEITRSGYANYIQGSGWVAGSVDTWTGNASSVNFGEYINGVTSITFTIELATVAVTGVSLNKETSTLTVGDTETLTATVSPDGATDKTVTWSSSDTDVATVENGVVTAVGSGTANITVTTTDGSKTASCAVTVNAAVVTSTVSLNANGGTINSGNITEYTEGTGATLPTDVTRDGYTFGGWYDNADLSGEPVTAISADATGDKEYWAKWIGDDNTVDESQPISEPDTPSDDSDSVVEPQPIDSADTDTPSVVPAETPVYTNTSGSGSSWTLGSSGTLEFRFSRSVNDADTINHFAGIKVDGTVVDPVNYTYNAGSVIINLNSGYLQTLAAGEHTLTAMFDDGEDVTIGFTIAAAVQEATPTPAATNTTVPSTGEGASMTAMFGILMILGSGILFAVSIKTSKHKFRKSKI